VSAWVRSPLVVGHRGGRGDGWPTENTLAAFSQAREQGARAIELDVRTCAGGDVVVFHDATLERLTGGRDVRPVSAVPRAEIHDVKLVGGGTVPMLSEVLAWARRCDVAVNVEMKHDVPHRPQLARATAAAVRASGADVLLSSFDPSLLALAAAVAPAVPRALLTHTTQERWADVLQEWMRPSLVRALHVERTQAQSDAVVRYRQRGLRVGVWTVNDPDEARDLVRLGVASIITDRPGDILRALLGP
jgi:glycerophosphoryl diester phosphodiesterase